METGNLIIIIIVGNVLLFFALTFVIIYSVYKNIKNNYPFILKQYLDMARTLSPSPSVKDEDVECKIEKTPFGTWRRYRYPIGTSFAEFKSHKKVLGMPLVHYTYGICPETNRRIVAKGIIAIGRLAMGFIAIGQASFGLIAMGQLAIGLLFGLGQGSTGVVAIGQLALGIAFALGQIAVGYIAIGQVGIGIYVLAQVGIGLYVWSQAGADPVAVEFFKSLPTKIAELLI